jgi:SAM-dependent methyltransferase
MDIPISQPTDTLAPQEYWDQGYKNLALEIAPPPDLVRIWLTKHLASGTGACLELGCFPGRYLAVLGELGYELNGIDLTPRVVTELPRWLKQAGYRVGEFARADVWMHEYKRQFEVVASFGLLEHFENWPELLLRHAQLTKPGGWLVVTVPNFRGALQQRLHRWLDRDNLERHNLQAMEPQAWAKVIQASGFRPTFCGYFGRFDFWEGGQKGLTWAQRTALRFIAKSLPWLRQLPESPAYSPYCGLVAQKG